MAYSMQAARRMAGKTPAEMAALLGVPPEAYRRMERCPETVTVEQARRFSQITGVDIDGLNFFAQDST